MAEPLIPYALKDGRIVHVDSVARGRACDCTCPACNGLLVARKGDIRVHHFAHDTYAIAICEGESALHATAKHLLFQRIQDALREKRDIPLSWRCQVCPEACQHDGNLLKRTATVRMEQTVPGANIRPDILLTNDDGFPAALLEIAYTNIKLLDGAVIRYAKDNNLPLLEFRVKTADDLVHLNENILTPQTAFIPSCPCPTCRYCEERVCAPDNHSHCQHCNKIYDPGYGPKDGHYFCEQCQQCVDAPSDFSIFHWHCRDCGIACYGTSGRYVRCFCCFNERKFGVKCTARNRLDHRHCKSCGRVFNDQGIYEDCYKCHKIAHSQAMREYGQAQQEQEKARQEAEKEQEKIRQARERDYELKREQWKQDWAPLQRDLDKSIARRQSQTGP